MNALSPALLDRRHHGLWSLWDMLEFRASAFYNAVSTIQKVQGKVEIEKDDPESQFHEDTPIPEGSRIRFSDLLKQLDGCLAVINCEVTRKMVARLLQQSAKKEFTWGQIYKYVEDLHIRMFDELTLRKLYVLEQERTKYFEPDAPLFGVDVANKFVSTVFEIDEAGKCLALGRSTASVFHLMRVMEIGIRATARCLSIDDPVKPAERNWGHILKTVKDELDAHSGKAPKAWSRIGDQDFFDAAYASLDAVRVVWRNPTMHVEKKYTDDEAEHVFGAVRGFMTRLASRCDENGEPKA
jgi:hypothetical protein